MNSPKSTSFEYGKDYQLDQAEKYRNRRANHWQARIGLAHKLIDDYVVPRLRNKPPRDIVVVDVGCSIGTFAIELAKKGYRCYGIDFDPDALGIAHELSQEENVSPEFICGDVADWGKTFPSIDIAVCFDIFEHLHDDELGALLVAIRRGLSANGSLIFHTFPTQYDHLFFWKPYVRYPLAMLRRLPQPIFNRFTKAYADLFDIGLLLKRGFTHREGVKLSGHCNTTTSERLKDILVRAGYEVVLIESSNLYPFFDSVQQRLACQPITHRNLYGVAIPKRT
jgi:2-polyprenyl-3-methyl-5-hydroxy-6-metoxy-1,4-benzoquinol methylase